jgi:hypothetical protein
MRTVKASQKIRHRDFAFTERLLLLRLTWIEKT